MNKSSIILLVICLTHFNNLNAQLRIIDSKDVINPRNTTDSIQQINWIIGKGKYSAKPRSMIELGVHFGHFITIGDVDPLIPGGFGLGIHLRKAFNYNASVRASIFYGQSYGLDPQLTVQSVAALDLNSTTARNKHHDIYRNYKLKDLSIQMEGLFNIGNVLFHRTRSKFNWYIGGGVGLDFNRTYINALNGNEPYDFTSISGNVDSRSGRKSIIKQIKAKLDNSYETEARKKVAIYRYNDITNVHLLISLNSGISFKISDRVNLTLEHQILSTDNDLLDGFTYRSAVDQSNSPESSHYSNIRIGINIGNKSRRTEPLYWLNPLNNIFEELNAIKNIHVFDTSDLDQDGILDMFDLEPYTPRGASVDVRGRVLDSDHDQIPDYLDQQPFSPPGFTVDSNGLAELIESKLNSGLSKFGLEVKNMMDEKIEGRELNWFLPVIHFDSNKYDIKDSHVENLIHVADVMTANPKLKIVVTGHTDSKNSNEFNKVLAYKRALAAIEFLVTNVGIDRTRLILNYKGEESPQININAKKVSSGRQESINYYNRRVEFKTFSGTEEDMSSPDGKKDTGR